MTLGEGLTIGWYSTWQGEGPVHLIGSHCIDFFANMDGEAEDEEEEDEMEVGKVNLIPVLCLFGSYCYW